MRLMGCWGRCTRRPRHRNGAQVEALRVRAGDLTGCDERVASLLAEIEALKRPLREFVETLSPS